MRCLAPLLGVAACVYGTASKTKTQTVSPPHPPTNNPLKPKQSVEQHLALLIEDLLKYGSQSTVTAAEALVLREAFLGLHYVWRMRCVCLCDCVFLCLCVL